MILTRFEDVKTFPLYETISLALNPSIMMEISDYLRVITQEIHINLAIDNDKIVTQLPVKIPIYRINVAQYQYVSQIAHVLAAKINLIPVEICQNLQLPLTTADVSHHNHLKLRIWYSDLGQIYFQLPPSSMLIWLDYIHTLQPNLDDIVNPPTRIHRSSTPQSPVSISIYAHARCCARLRLAGTEKIVSFDDRWQITTPNWSICDRDRRQNCSTTDRSFIFELPAENRLIQALMDVLDGIYSQTRCERPQNWAKLSFKLAERWLEFDRDCQIFGDTKRQNPRLAMARCGLTVIARRYLQVLLEEYLGVRAPVEL
jgi:hypothetical protein